MRKDRKGKNSSWGIHKKAKSILNEALEKAGFEVIDFKLSKKDEYKPAPVTRLRIHCTFCGTLGQMGLILPDEKVLKDKIIKYAESRLVDWSIDHCIKIGENGEKIMPSLMK